MQSIRDGYLKKTFEVPQASLPNTAVNDSEAEELCGRLESNPALESSPTIRSG